MGVTFLWLSVGIPSERVDEVASRFAEAVAASPVSPAARRVLERWREDPDSLSPEHVPDPTRPGALMESEGVVDFEELFRPKSLIELGQGFFMKGAETQSLGIEATAENAGVFVNDRVPASAALYFGLGAERAARLPGHFGALFVVPGEVAQVLASVEALLGQPSEEMRARAWRWLGRGNNDFSRLDELFEFIPRALRTAHARGEGMLLLTTRG
ncbi:hypothetical protein JY651_16585 [Pyxidicoccus parkwayensis]|jgi:hypothetical protein|uniref:Uncharacterized protein n=1 Tax=Pyxidicoccus parkwayensis TaxID=2813578 RepID=A0ABX7P7M8_9BACT|nr:hypothetical protein [Pyxidicoccus parkwaysis]QSQ26444.1 hypothetical protein JY651_16585 [Pyxidicoccus parkwaysis]